MHWLMDIGEYTTFSSVFTIAFLIAHKKRTKVVPTTAKQQKTVNYWYIARLEIELFGETKPNYDSPIKPWCLSWAEVNGIDKTGHYEGNKCNVNASLGPTCTKIIHRKRVMAKMADQQNPYKVLINPYADHAYDEDMW